VAQIKAIEKDDLLPLEGLAEGHHAFAGGRVLLLCGEGGRRTSSLKLKFSNSNYVNSSLLGIWGRLRFPVAYQCT